MESNGEPVVWNTRIGVDVLKDSNDTGGLSIVSTGVVVIDSELGVGSGVLERIGECGVNEGEIGNKGCTGTIGGLCWPDILLFDALESALVKLYIFKKISSRFENNHGLTIPLDTPSPTTSFTTSQEVTDEPIPWISC